MRIKLSRGLLLAITLAVFSLVGLGYALGALAGGLFDVPRHWWSTLPVLGLFAAGISIVVTIRRGRTH